MILNCQYCNYQTNIRSNFKKHLTTKKHLQNIKIEEIEEKNEEKSIKSISVNKEIIPKIDILNTNIFCQWCTRSFTRKDNLKRHLMVCKQNPKQLPPQLTQKNNKTNNVFNCIFCKIEFTSQQELQKHYKACNNVDTIKEKKFINNDYHKDLKKIHCYPTVIPPLPSYINSNKCQYCNNLFASRHGLSRHVKICYQKNIKLQTLEQEKLNYIHQLDKQKEINKEKEKQIQIAKHSQPIYNITNNNTINYLNINYGNMIAMEQFLYNLEHSEKLTNKERENLLTSYKENGIDVFARNFSYIMKQNCKRQLEKVGINDLKLLPLFCSDGNLRSHKEKGIDGWKTHYDNNSINKMLNISNNQVYETHHEMLPIIGKERTKIFKEIKRDNHENKIKYLDINK